MTKPNLKAVPETTTEEEQTWAAILCPGPGGAPKNNIANALIYIGFMPDLSGKICYNEFSNNIVITGETPCFKDSRIGSNIKNGDDVTLTGWLQLEGYNISNANIKAAILPASQNYPFNPVKNYLDGLKWDQVERTEAWLINYLGVPSTEYAMAVGERWLISAVSRIFDPGCQADTMLILEGKQGTGKSTALRILGGEWFTDQLPDLGTKDASVQLQGSWIIEMSELDTLTKSEAGEAKQFISRRVDKFRPPYGTIADDFPRQCVFAGTVNGDSYLKDETGGRRFWPVACGTIDIKSLIEDRDQLWAEAAHKYKAGHVSFLNSKRLVDMARVEVAKREHVDVWHDLISEKFGNVLTVRQCEIIAAIGIEDGNRNNGHSMRVNRVMAALDFMKKRDKNGIYYTRHD